MCLPLYVQALRVSVGVLGIITRVKLPIIKDVPVQRKEERLTLTQYLSLMDGIQGQYKKNQTWPAWVNDGQMMWGHWDKTVSIVVVSSHVVKLWDNE